MSSRIIMSSLLRKTGSLPMSPRCSIFTLAASQHKSSYFYCASLIKLSSKPRYLFRPLRFLSTSPASSSLVSTDDSEMLRKELLERDGYIERMNQQGFPFEIDDNLGEQGIILKREFGAESIQVVVTPDFKSQDLEKINLLYLVVTVAKGNGTCLEFSCTIKCLEKQWMWDRTKEEEHLLIDRLLIKGHEASPNHDIAHELKLDATLSKAFRKYLKIRGINRTLDSPFTPLQTCLLRKLRIECLRGDQIRV